MQIKVTNRGTAEVINFDIPYIVISIYSTGSSPANIPNHLTCLGILPICFDDVPYDINTDRVQCKAIAEDQADQIWTFVDYYLNCNKDISHQKAELILIHCDAGVCRSPAVAAAIDLVYTGNNSKWFKPFYLPNKKVYTTMLQVKGLSNDYIE